MTLDIDEAKVVRNPTGLWLGWTIATALGLVIGYLPSALFLREVDLGLARIIVPLLAGILIGVAQWLVLRGYVTRSADWVLNLTASWVVGYAVGLLVVDLLAHSILGVLLAYLLFGAIVGLFQWPVLRREIPHLWTWVLANMAGWALGAVLAQAAVNAMFGDAPAEPVALTLVSMAITGVVAGLITGLALSRIVRAPDRAATA